MIILLIMAVFFSVLYNIIIISYKDLAPMIYLSVVGVVIDVCFHAVLH